MAANVPIVFNEALNVSRMPADAPLWRKRSVGLYGALRARTRRGQRTKIPHDSLVFLHLHHVPHVLLHVTTLRTLTCYMHSKMDRFFPLELIGQAGRIATILGHMADTLDASSAAQSSGVLLTSMHAVGPACSLASFTHRRRKSCRSLARSKSCRVGCDEQTRVVSHSPFLLPFLFSHGLVFCLQRVAPTTWGPGDVH
jgi:hypothetical protein